MPTVAPRAEELAWIEGLRGLAALLVMLTHYAAFVRPQGAGLWGLAATGVDLFFVLSGFVFARVLGAGRVAWGPHLLRRLFRLYPLYLLALLMYALLRPVEGRWDAAPAHLLMLHTTGSLQQAAAYNVAFWSLPPEVEFYLLLPLLAPLLALMASALVARGLHRWGLSGLGVLLLFVLALKLGLVATAQPGESKESLRSILTVHAPGLLVEFLLGSAVAVWGGHVTGTHLGSAWSLRARQLTAALAALGLVALLVLYEQHLSTPQAAAQSPLWFSGTLGLWAAAVAAGLMLLVPAQGAQAAGSGAVLGLAYWAGRLSYGLYLFHNAAPVLVQRVWPDAQGAVLVAASFALTVMMAAVAHRLIEAPARAYGRRWAASLSVATSTRMSGGSR